MGVFDNLDYGRVPAATWTKIYSGPRLQPLPFLNFNFRTVPKGSSDTTVAWTIHVYSTSVSYNSRSGTSPCLQSPTTTLPELLLADPPAVWLDVWIITDITIDAKCWSGLRRRFSGEHGLFLTLPAHPKNRSDTVIGVFIREKKAVPGHSCWPQDGPFDANLALLVSCNTSFIRSSTTHKTPESAEPFTFSLR